MSKKEKELEELRNKYLRLLADYQNLEKRSLDEKREWAKISNKELLLRLLPVLDTLILAGKHFKNEGLELSIKQFQEVLKGEGVEKIETVGREFDAKLMEAIDVVDGEEGKVIEEVMAGYLLNDNLLRPARVKVGKQKDEKEILKQVQDDSAK